MHGGLLAIRDDAAHAQSMTEHGIAPIDLLVVNLYPFEATVAKGAAYDDCVENIDIGGPAMIRAAAKNHDDVAVVVDADDYARVLAELAAHGGATTLALAQGARRRRPMRAPPPMTRRSPTGSPASSARRRRPTGRSAASSPRRCATARTRTRARRSIARREQRFGVATARQVQGKQLSYNNINDTDAAYECVAEFDPKRSAACVIVKHANPCGVAEGASLVEAYRKALRLRSDLGVRRHRGAQRHARRARPRAPSPRSSPR